MSAPAPVRLLTAAVRATALTVRGALASALALFLLAGVPYGLIRYIGWPLPHHLASLGQLEKTVTGPVLGDQVYLDAIAIVIWLLWLLIAISFAAETIALIRGVELPPLPGLRPTQALVVILLTAIGITALMARVAAPAEAATTHVPARAPASTAPRSPGTAQTDATATNQPSTQATGPSPADPAETSHTVVSGDNLYDIARADYGNGDDWRVLYTINAGHTQPDGDKLTDPNLIQPGWVLATTEPAPATSQAHSPNATSPDTSPSATEHAATPTTPAHATPAPTATRSASEHPDTGSTPTPHRTPSSPVAPGHRAARPAAANSEWIELAEGGALAAGVVAALALALARARRRRRWHGTCYWPTPGQRQLEPLTVPVPLRPAPRPATGDHPSDSWELDEFGAPTGPQPSNPAATPREETAHADTSNSPGASVGPRAGQGLREAGPARVAVAAGDGHSLALHELPPVLALSGPGALSAARAVAAAVLCAAEHRRDGARLLITRHDAALLLEHAGGELAKPLPTLADLEVFDDAPGAVTGLEAHALARTRLLEEHQVDTLEEICEEDDFPPVLLIALARPETADRVTAAIGAGTGLRVHAILLGEHPGAARWHVEPDGRLTGPDAPHGTRTFHLSAPALGAALTVLAAASGEETAEQALPTAPDPLGELAVPETEPELLKTRPAPAPALDAADTAETVAEVDPREEANVQSETACEEWAATTVRLEVGGTVPGNRVRPSQPNVPSPGRPGPATDGPLLLAVGPDKVAEIIEGFTACLVQVKVLGVRAITTPTGTIDARLRADAWRLAMRLAVVGRHAQHHEDLAALWPDQDDQALRSTVKNAVYDLRKTLRQRCGDPASHPGRYVTQADHRYAFNEHTIGVDLATFTALRTLAARTRDPGERRAAATAALELYGGELLAGEEEAWMIAPRTKVRRDALATATLLAQLADHAHEPETALGWWERALEIDDNEEVYRQIITAQLSLGHQADALATCALLTARLNADELVAAPETMTLIARARGNRPTPPHAGTPRRGETAEHTRRARPAARIS